MVIPEKDSGTDCASQDTKNCKYPQQPRSAPAPTLAPRRKGRKEQAVWKWESLTKHATYKSQGKFLKHFCIKSFLKRLRSHCHFSNKICCNMHVSASHSINCSPEDFSGLVERGNVTEFLKHGWSSVSKLHVVPSMALGHTPTPFCCFLL